MVLNKEELEALIKLLKTEYGEVHRTLEDKFQEILNSAKDYELCLWDFYWDYGRQGEVEGRFKATKKQVENILGNRIYFGEILGKHSEVVNTIDKEDVTLVSDDPFVVMDSECSGYDPFDYWTCERCGCPLDPDTGLCEDCDKDKEEGE